MLTIACSVLVCQYYLNGWTISVTPVWVRRSDFIWNNWKKITVLFLPCIIHMKGISKYTQPLTCFEQNFAFSLPCANLIWGVFANLWWVHTLLHYFSCLRSLILVHQILITYLIRMLVKAFLSRIHNRIWHSVLLKPKFFLCRLCCSIFKEEQRGYLLKR